MLSWNDLLIPPSATGPGLTPDTWDRTPNIAAREGDPDSRESEVGKIFSLLRDLQSEENEP
jgi:hypothetical protein